MALLIGLIPALFWGIYPVWLKRLTGGNFLEQVLGTGTGNFSVSRRHRSSFSVAYFTS
jgi:hypothetical protein